MTDATTMQGKLTALMCRLDAADWPSDDEVALPMHASAEIRRLNELLAAGVPANDDVTTKVAKLMFEARHVGTWENLCSWAEGPAGDPDTIVAQADQSAWLQLARQVVKAVRA